MRCYRLARLNRTLLLPLNKRLQSPVGENCVLPPRTAKTARYLGRTISSGEVSSLRSSPCLIPFFVDEGNKERKENSCAEILLYVLSWAYAAFLKVKTARNLCNCTKFFQNRIFAFEDVMRIFHILPDAGLRSTRFRISALIFQ